MKIAKISACIIRVPMKKTIAHASHTRDESDNVYVRCELADGTVGMGEGVPRSYVTGETAEGALAMFHRSPILQQLDEDVSDWAGVVELCDRIDPIVGHDDPRGCGANSLRCAIELSVLDAFGQCFGQPIHRVMDVLHVENICIAPEQAVRYSTTITADNPTTERKNAIKMRIYGFRHCKIKVGMPGIDEISRLKRLRFWLGRSMDIRIDANEAWDLQQAVAILSKANGLHLSFVEQPLPHAMLLYNAELRQRMDVPIMLDESLTSLIDARTAIEAGACDALNIRLSKCGGFINAARIASFARAAGIEFQLGCHPGETGILSAAGRHWSCRVGGLRAIEGSYDHHLLREIRTTPDITFGYGGVAPRIDAPGLGVKFINDSDFA